MLLCIYQYFIYLIVDLSCRYHNYPSPVDGHWGCFHLLPMNNTVYEHLYISLCVKKVEVKVAQSCLTLCNPMDWGFSPWNSPGQNTGVGSLSLLQGIFPSQGSSPGLPHCRWILYQLSHKGSPRILEWVAFPFSRGIFPTQGLNLGLPRIPGGFFTSWATREAQEYWSG